MPDGRATVHGVGVLCVPGPHHTAFTEYRSAGAVSRLSPRGDLAHRPKSFARRTRRSFSPDRVSGSSRPGQPVLLAPRGRPAMRDVLRCGGHFASLRRQSLAPPRPAPRTASPHEHASPCLAPPRAASRRAAAPALLPRACIALRYASRGRVCVGRVPAANKPASPYAFGAASTRRRRSAIRPVPATRVRLAATPSPGCSKPAPWSAGRRACASRPRQVPGVTSACRSPASRRRSGPRRPGRHRGPSGCS